MHAIGADIYSIMFTTGIFLGFVHGHDEARCA